LSITKCIAMWSCPRNISTAMMRSWGSRPDSIVIDEPFYAHYLKESQSPHPGAQEIMQTQSTDWREVIEQLKAPLPKGKTVFYQKHITTHMLPHIELDWLSQLYNLFLIRHPSKAVASYSQKRSENVADDLGYAQLHRIFEHVCSQQESIPIVIDSDSFLKNPADHLLQICNRLEIDYTPSMLEWEPGIRQTDGIWHQWWYDAVASSTGFRPFQPKDITLTSEQKKIVSECEPHYLALRSHALTTNNSVSLPNE